MDLYQKNLNYLKENLPSIYKSLQSDESMFGSRVSEIDPLNLKVEYDDKNCYLHSLYNTNRETAAMVCNVDRNAEMIVVFGMGLWYSYDYLISYFKSLNHIIIIEPDLNLFKSILNFIDMKSVTNKCKTTFIVNRSIDDAIEALWTLFSVNISTKFEFIFNLSYRSLYGDYYRCIYQGATDKIKNCLINTATVDTYVYRWAENVIKNFRYNALPITKILGPLTELPIIIVSAGPSLNSTMQFLNQARNKAVILAVGSAIKILDSNGIVPHLRMALDPDANEMNVFNNIDTEAAALIFSDRLYYKVLDHYKGHKIRILLDTDCTSQYIYPKLYNEKFIIDSGFSVANVALNAAIKLGFTKIILIGQDLCYTEGSLYAKGSWTEEIINEKDEKYIKTINSIGETVYTDRVFIGMKNVFENFIRLNPNRTYINATERGLDILGTVNKSIIKVIEEDLPESVDIDQIIENIFNQNEVEDIVWQQMITQLNIEGHIIDLKELNELRLKNLKKLKKYFERRMGTNKLRSELAYINKNLTDKIQNDEFYKVAVAPSLTVFLYATNLKYLYEGNDEVKYIENRVNCLLEETALLKQYLDALLYIISDLDDN